MLTRRAATEILVHEENGSAIVFRLVQGMVFFLARRMEALVKKGIVSHAGERHFFKIASWNNSVVVIIVPLDGNRRACDSRDLDNFAHGPSPTDSHARRQPCRSKPPPQPSPDS